MPIYEYICNLCETKFEILHRTSQENRLACPKCGTEDIQKIFSVFGFSSGGKFVSSSSGEGCSDCGHRNCSHCG